ncbi:zinc transporter ZIP11-like [Babylonia areolata]|uniref:zinc transporter ZIP11-like n=1 Tax=Babylonia areolata TaxID=304850 RepID=UPI003FD1AEAF
MIEDAGPVLQTLLGTFFTWGLTALGAGLVFVFSSGQRKLLDGSLGFAAGVMTAASYWSLLAPAIEMAESSGLYGANGQWAFVPVAVGFALGAAFVFGADILLPHVGGSTTNLALTLETGPKQEDDNILLHLSVDGGIQDTSGPAVLEERDKGLKRRGLTNTSSIRQQEDSVLQVSSMSSSPSYHSGKNQPQGSRQASWRRILLLIIAITIHNIPEGLAVGVGFGAVGKSKAATFESARNLAIGIGIQNFPEGLAVSLPLRGSGMSLWKSFWYGQLSGMVEPAAGLFGALAVVVAEPILPYALAFAAGAMIYVVVDDIIPEAQTCGNGKLASWGAMLGFIVMMSLDVGLG